MTDNRVVINGVTYLPGTGPHILALTVQRLRDADRDALPPIGVNGLPHHAEFDPQTGESRCLPDCPSCTAPRDQEAPQ